MAGRELCTPSTQGPVCLDCASLERQALQDEAQRSTDERNTVSRRRWADMTDDSEDEAGAQSSCNARVCIATYEEEEEEEAEQVKFGPSSSTY